MNLTAKEYLRNVRHAGLMLRIKADSMARLRDLSVRITGSLESPRVQMDREFSRVEEAAVELADLYGEAADEVREYAALRRGALAVIDRLKDSRYKAVLELRYVSCHTWPEVVEMMAYEVSWVHRLHAEALKALDETRTLNEF